MPSDIHPWAALPAFAALFLLVLSQAGCYHRHYQPEPDGRARVLLPLEPGLPGEDDPATPWRLAAIEFDDQGDTWEDRAAATQVGMDQLRKALETMNQLKAGRTQLNLLVFIHGWHHNAKPEDGNLHDFQNVVARVAQASHRPTMGVFIGWRGRILPAFLDYPTSYWGRHAAAQRVGGIRCTEVLFRLSREARADLDDVTVVFIGHSFGARVLETALGQSIIATVAGDASLAAVRQLPFDLAVLVNEASEAKAGSQILAALKEEQVPRIVDEQSGKDFPLLLNLTSTADKATLDWLPAGQFFATLPPFLAGGLRQGSHGQVKDYPSQWSLNIHSLAHTPFFHSHDLVKTGTGSAARFSLEPRKGAYNDTPYYVVREEHHTGLITGHNDIFTEPLREFLTSLVVDRLKEGGTTMYDTRRKIFQLRRPAQMRLLRRP